MTAVGAAMRLIAHGYVNYSLGQSRLKDLLDPVYILSYLYSCYRQECSVTCRVICSEALSCSALSALEMDQLTRNLHER